MTSPRDERGGGSSVREIVHHGGTMEVSQRHRQWITRMEAQGCRIHDEGRAMGLQPRAGRRPREHRHTRTWDHALRPPREAQRTRSCAIRHNEDARPAPRQAPHHRARRTASAEDEGRSTMEVESARERITKTCDVGVVADETMASTDDRVDRAELTRQRIHRIEEGKHRFFERHRDVQSLHLEASEEPDALGELVRGQLKRHIARWDFGGIERSLLHRRRAGVRQRPSDDAVEMDTVRYEFRGASCVESHHARHATRDTRNCFTV